MFTSKQKNNKEKKLEMKKEIQLDKNGKRAFGMRDKLSYAAGDLGCNMSFALKSSIMVIFWTQFMALGETLYATLLLIVQAWDAINDPLLGSLFDMDKRAYKHGKFKTYIFIGAVGLLFSGLFFFLPVPGAPKIMRCVLFVLGYVLWDAFYTVANVPYGSMMSVITTDGSERSQLSTWRSIGSMLGNMVPMMILPMLIWKKVTYDGTGIIPLLDGTHHINPETKQPYQIGEQMINPLTGAEVEQLLGERVFWAALIMGILGFAAFMFMIRKITIRVDENSVVTNENAEKINIVKSFGKFMKNRPAVGCTIAAMGMFLGMQSASTANTIMFATYFGKASLSGVVMIIGFLPMFLFMPFIKKIVDKYGKKEASVAGTLLSLVGGAVMIVFPLVPRSAALIVYMLGLVIFGVGMGIYTCVSWAMMGDAIDYNEWKFGTREEGTVYSLHSFFRKLAQGVGPAAVILIMGWLGYDETLGTIGQSAQTASNMCWLVAILYLFSAVAQFIGLAVFYNIDKKTLATMTAELEARRTAEENVEV